jgi:hypothetical protein
MADRGDHPRDLFPQAGMEEDDCGIKSRWLKRKKYGCEI